MNYKKEDIINKCNELMLDINTFYKSDIVNYRGKASCSDDYYTEVIAEFICDNIKKFENSITKISRKNSYKCLTHKGQFSNLSNREEEIVAMKLFNECNNHNKKFNFIGKVIDYQVPLKSEKCDVAGKIDLLAYDGKILRILELKKSESKETMLRCALEGFTYMKTVDKEKLLSDFNLPSNTILKSSPLVYKGKEQYNEMMENRKYLTKMMELLDIEPFYLDIVNQNFVILDK